MLGTREKQDGEHEKQDIIEITKAELELLKSIDFDFDIDTPFCHFDRWKQTLISVMPDESLIRVCNSIIVDICLMICSEFYLDVPPEVAAAAATEGSISSDLIPTETLKWLNSVKEKYGTQLFSLALESIQNEKKITAFQQPVKRK